MEIKKQNYWRDSMVVFIRVSTWIIVPVVCALLIGKKLDTYFDTKSWIFLGSIFVASLVTIYGIMKTIKTYMKDSLDKKDGK